MAMDGGRGSDSAVTGVASVTNTASSAWMEPSTGEREKAYTVAGVSDRAPNRQRSSPTAGRVRRRRRRRQDRTVGCKHPHRDLAGCDRLDTPYHVDGLVRKQNSAIEPAARWYGTRALRQRLRGGHRLCYLDGRYRRRAEDDVHGRLGDQAPVRRRAAQRRRCGRRCPAEPDS